MLKSKRKRSCRHFFLKCILVRHVYCSAIWFNLAAMFVFVQETRVWTVNRRVSAGSRVNVTDGDKFDFIGILALLTSSHI